MALRQLGFVGVCGVITALLLGGTAQAQENAGTQLLKNPGFEGEYHPAVGSGDKLDPKARITGQVAADWEDNSGWANVAVEYGRETVNPHRGMAAQRITVKDVPTGALQFVQRVALQKDHVYDFRVWLRGRPGAGISLVLRKSDAPYTSYAETNAPLSAEWQEFRVLGVAPEDVAGYLMLIARSPQTFYVDDAQLLDLTNAQSNAPARVGNMLTGGSFEAGISYGWSVRVQPPTADQFRDPRPVVDATTAIHGKQSLRVDLPADSLATINSPLIHYNGNRVHTVSLWMKSSVPDTSVGIQLEKTNISKWVRIGTEWQRVTLSSKLPFLPYTNVRCTVLPASPARTVWLDGAQMEERAEASPEYLPPFPLEMTLRLPRSGSVVHDGEKAAVLVRVAPQPPHGARLRLTAVDLFGGSYTLPTVSLPAASFPLPTFKARPRGMFKLRGVVTDAAGKPLSAPVEMVWARLPRPREIEPEKSFFGIHVPLAPDFFALARATGMRWVRLHDTSMIGKWAVAEPERDHFAFYDDAVTAAHKSGLAVLGMLDGAPGWASTKPREGGYWSLWHIPDAPDALPRWENYVRTVVGHYKGRIDNWEVWNEPWGQWFTGAGGPPELYGQLMRAAYKAAKAANPKANILGIDTYRGQDKWTEGALAACGADCYDGFSFHDYNDALYGGAESIPVQTARLFTEAQAKYGTPRPLWNTEGGPGQIGSFYAPETGGISPRQQLAQAVRFDVTYMAAGVKAFFLYAVHTDAAMGDTMYRAAEHDRAIRPILAARAVLASLVDGAGVPKRTEPVKGLDAYTYPPQAGKRVTVLWSEDGAPHSASVPKGARVLDILGNPLRPARGRIAVSPEPIYLIH